LGFNYHYLWGLRYDTGDFNLRIDTDSNGRVTIPPPPSSLPVSDLSILPLLIDRHQSTEGRGFSLDFGIGVVKDRWDFGMGINGVANRIQWEELSRKQHLLVALTAGPGIVNCDEPLIPTGPVAIVQGSIVLRCLPAPAKREEELPVRYVASVARYGDGWTAAMDVAYGFENLSVRGGTEYKLGPLALRAGSRVSRGHWEPTGGFGVDFFPRLGLDVAFFGNSANIEEQRELSMAMSLRISLGGE
jgi:hypothetical protein